MTDVPPSVPPSPAVPDAVLAELARLCEATKGEFQFVLYSGEPETDPARASYVGLYLSSWGGPPPIEIERSDVGEDSWPATVADVRYMATACQVLPALIFELAARRAADAGRGGP